MKLTISKLNCMTIGFILASIVQYIVKGNYDWFFYFSVIWCAIIIFNEFIAGYKNEKD